MTCASCGAPRSGGRFCANCGAVVAAGPKGSTWIAAGGATILVILLAAIVIPERRARVAAAAPPVPALNPAGARAAPDISGLSPRERFDRLYARALQASQTGDDAGAAQFTPMALAAYQMLDTIDADARYHAALLHLHAGRVAPARLLADTLLAEDPGHLFGYLLRATAARWERDSVALAAAYRDFLAHEAAETARGRPEYDAHRATIDEAARLARQAGAAP